MSKRRPLKIIAGTPDRPLLIGDIEIPCYVLEDETRILSQRGMQLAIGMSTRRRYWRNRRAANREIYSLF